ncbi:helix-turn-helix transcriptional regulator [Flavobacterium sp. WV_118_3]|uniref:helix-turn-helix domain-containing protein n=1 Tax=Flavobacterium sp. WV_118_3 TaxID=3151764 RepID=UPI0012D02295|nr:AraC family transcriptional regulator [Flavobacterium sp.]HRB71604.1 helix-turn-helix transcriptional regulator [Flavobacterium sp.]
MKQLKTGQFFGATNSHLEWKGLTITDTEYTHEKVDWHYHEKPYFTFIIQGKVLEGNRKEIYECTAGSLLFHNWDDAHYNKKPPGFTRGFHIEIAQHWLDRFDLSLDSLQGSIAVKNPDVKLLFYKLFYESKIHDNASHLATDALLVEVLENIKGQNKTVYSARPDWIKPLQEILHEDTLQDLSLSQLSALLGIHPVHISRYFPKYFGCSLGNYIRKLKVEKSLALLPDKHTPLTSIALDSGFSDQSHFIRCFKENMGITPLAFRKRMHF